ncbi:MAG: hypothetical protein ABIT96_03725 [Ferruginibacter sp.]
MKYNSFFLAAFFLFTTHIFLACNNEQQYDINTETKYEKSKDNLTETERKNPDRFLHVQGNNKKNLLGQTVVKGIIFNNAKMVTYKDVDIKIDFYSKTGALLEEDHEVVFETITPGGSKSFKSKFFTPRGTDSVTFKVITAKY